MKILTIFGTRPEAIKMAPVITALQKEPSIENVVCVTGQHRQMLDQVMDLFGLQADYDLDVMVPNQTLNGLFAKILEQSNQMLEEVKPDCVLVHGDTSTASACALAAFHRGIQVGHVEAGLRTGDIRSPFPEEMNRRLVDGVSQWMFAPTQTSRQNLLKENLPGSVHVTGNTVIDALSMTCERLTAGGLLASDIEQRFSWLDPSRKLLLVTGHRRESFGDGFRQICSAIDQLASREDLQIVYPVHMNPQVRGIVHQTLSDRSNIHLIDPLGYLDFVWFMRRADIILTDSGGVQEEAPHLGKPVLVMRDVTERPEAVLAGTVQLVGTDPKKIHCAVSRLLDDQEYRASFSKSINPYGDGLASERIARVLSGQSVQEFIPASN